jgi:hypothetical protein
MSPRSHALAALAAGAAALAVPAAASAASTTVVAGPVKVKAYSMSLVASKGGLSVTLTRRAGKSSQLHFYSVARGVSVKVPGSLSGGTIKASLGRYGKVKLKLRASGKLRRGVIPKGCTGKSGRSRSGTLTGTFKLKADDGRYFGTIRQRKLPAQAIRGGTLKCEGTGGGKPGQGGTPKTTMLSRSITGGDGGFTSFVASRTGRRVFETVTRTESPAATAPLTILHSINAPAPSGAFDVASDLGSASVKGAGRFLTGSLAFRADNKFGQTAMGTATGNLTAKFDPLGKVSLTAGDAPTTLFKG